MALEGSLLPAAYDTGARVQHVNQGAGVQNNSSIIASSNSRIINTNTVHYTETVFEPGRSRMREKGPVDG